ncbi:recombinase family protein [Bacillus salitolerans]|uniref:Recombinase family protein n=1 Tax=Bacillus salitolerans TaxID=1437434 RepID=A0ABW4LN28_9BACI
MDLNTVKTIFENEMYIGNTKWRGKISKGKHIPIIETSLWEEKIKVMGIRSFIPEKVYPGSYPLSGLLKCPQCELQWYKEIVAKTIRTINSIKIKAVVTIDFLILHQCLVVSGDIVATLLYCKYTRTLTAKRI